MRVLADLVKDTDSAATHYLVEILAAQVIAAAAYNHSSLDNDDSIRRTIRLVAGYPMLNRPQPHGPITPNVDTMTLDRVREIIKATRE